MTVQSNSVAVLALLTISNLCVGDDWPQWRGPRRDNISNETGLLQQWPKEGPPLSWRVEGLGTGIASIAVRDGAIFVLGYVGEHEYLTALDETTGRRRWATRLGPAVRENRLMRHRCQRMPTVDEELVFALSGTGSLCCLRVEDGVEVWRKDYAKDFQVTPPRYGILDNPLVDGDRLICMPGGPKSALVALNKQSGEVIWKCSTPGLGYGTFAPGSPGGVKQYVASVAKGLVGVSAES
ncbi:MAG: PQQ-like beta-propeller repeat protein, partial [Planctomycetales bacterium]